MHPFPHIVLTYILFQLPLAISPHPRILEKANKCKKSTRYFVNNIKTITWEAKNVADFIKNKKII